MGPKKSVKSPKSKSKQHQKQSKTKKIAKDKPRPRKEKKPAKKWKSKKTVEFVEKIINPESVPKNTVKLVTKNQTEKESLRNRMLKRLEAARFRQINEELDQGVENPQEAFSSNVDLFQKYHSAYKERIQHWPSDPLEIIIKYIKKKLPQDRVVADFGCGEARLAASVSHKVHSFDLFALNDRVVACDMSRTPLSDGTVDLAVFCLSLMGTDVSKYIAEANRVLKQKGILKIAEVSSRFPENNASGFIRKMKKFGFVTTDKVQQSNVKEEKSAKNTATVDVFLLMEFMKIRLVRNTKGKLAPLKLLPCTYKKR